MVNAPVPHHTSTFQNMPSQVTYEVSQGQGLMTPGLPHNTAPLEQQQQQQPQLPNLPRPPPYQPQLLPPVYDPSSPIHATLTNSRNATPLRTESNQPTRHCGTP